MAGSIDSHEHEKDGKICKFDIIPTRYIISMMGFMAMVSSYVMRNNLSVAIVAMVVCDTKNDTEVTECSTNSTSEDDEEEVCGDFEWDEETQGLLSGCFYWGYIVTQVVGGRLSERYGSKLIIGVGLVIGIVSTMISPVAAEVHPAFLGVVRIICGLGLAVFTPALHNILAKWAPPSERSRMSTITYVGCMMGVIIGNLVNGILCSADGPGWEWTFYIWGLVSIVVLVMWIVLVYDTPIDHPRISSKELNFILRSQNKSGASKPDEKKILPVPWKSIFKSPAVWALIGVCFGRNWTYYTLLTELPTYMRNVLGFNMSESGLYSSLPYVFNLIVQLAASALGDYLIKSKTFSVIFVRKVSSSIAAFLPSICLVGVAFIYCNTHAIYALLLVAVGIDGFISSGHQFNHADISPNFAGTLQGISNSFGTIPGMISPYITGVIVNGQQTQDQWNKVFFMSAGITVFFGILYDIWASGREQPWNNVDEKIGNETPIEQVFSVDSGRQLSVITTKSSVKSAN